MDKLIKVFSVVAYSFLLAVMTSIIVIPLGFLVVLSMALPVLSILNVIGLTAFPLVVLLRLVTMIMASFYVLALVYFIEIK